MIRVLHLFTTLNNGGVESFLYNYYSHMDQTVIRFDEVVPGEEIGYMEPMFKKLNSKVYHVERFKNNPIKHCISVAKIIREGNYDIIHCHGYKSIIGLIFAKKYGCKVRIIHSHMAYTKENFIERIIRKLIVFIAKKLATDKFSCGIDAANWLFGSEEVDKGKVDIINNAIDIHKYSYSEEKREKIRNELNIKNEFVIGNVARLTYQKNQEYLLDIIKELIKIMPKSKLLLIGEGEDEKILKRKCNELKIQENVEFLGLREDISTILSALDFFVLPSRYEGLPVVLAEVQAAGLYALISDTVTKEINVTNTLNYFSLSKSPKEWSNNIVKIYKESKKNNRNENASKMQNGKYDIVYQANNLLERYNKLIQKNRSVSNVKI